MGVAQAAGAQVLKGLTELFGIHSKCGESYWKLESSDMNYLLVFSRNHVGGCLERHIQ